MRPCATAQPRNSAQGVHIASGVVQIKITRNRTWDVSCRSTSAVEPAGSPLARTAGRPIDSLDALGTGRTDLPLQALAALGTGDPLGSLDRATTHPAAAGRVPHLQAVVGLNDVGITLVGTGRQLSGCGDLAAEVDAGAGRTLDALDALGGLDSLWTGLSPCCPTVL